ncbi:hypothetical protein RYH73_19460 [Olivibacter sp. CPCC 100613]|uniref:hypothetical protein n=1 Tax=Olivibacter sp. CPCC 100613 TaxID=3079931 RepID=UPI002FF7C3DD
MTKKFKNWIKGGLVVAVFSLGVLNLKIRINQSEETSGFTMAQLSVQSEAVQAECSNMSTGNNGHCRSNGGTGSCVDSYWFETNNCKK